MSEKRRDRQNRVLRDGEYQCADGRYRFRYKDEFGTQHDVYSWRLNSNDRAHDGKKDISLREMEQQIRQDMFNRTPNMDGKITVLQLAERYVSIRTGVRTMTQYSYRTVLNFLRRDEFGQRYIRDIRPSDAKEWLVRLQQEDGKGYSSIHSIRGVLRPAFQMAYEDDLILRNPFNFELVNVLVNDSVRRDAIKPEQEKKLLQFIQADPHFSRYYEAVYILFNTGLRISEFCGLTIQDIEFDEMRIKVDHQLQRGGDSRYMIQAPKTAAGIRYVPMTREVANCFRQIIEQRPRPRIEPMIDGYVGFLYLDKNDKPMVGMHWEKYFQHIVEKYNDIYRVQMPKVTPHVCRHTFCSKMARSGMNPKMLQYIMGHSDISVTLNTYTHVGFQDAQNEMRRVSNE